VIVALSATGTERLQEADGIDGHGIKEGTTGQEHPLEGDATGITPHLEERAGVDHREKRAEVDHREKRAGVDPLEKIVGVDPLEKIVGVDPRIENALGTTTRGPLIGMMIMSGRL
jgi:hypothetical protein